jgi:hypothetical protein
MRVRDFFVKIPELCGGKNADRWASIIGYVYDLELMDDSAFDRNAEDKADPDNRFEVVFAFNGGNPDKVEQCKRLVRILMFNHYLEDHNEPEYREAIEANYKVALAAQELYPDIADVMSVEDAMLEGWND